MNVVWCAGSAYVLDSGEKVPFTLIGALNTDLSLPYNPAEGFPFNDTQYSSNVTAKPGCRSILKDATRAAALVALLQDDPTPASAHIDAPENIPSAIPAGHKRAIGLQAGVHTPVRSLNHGEQSSIPSS